MSYKLSASLMGMDLLNVEQQLKVLNTRAVMNHVDIIDWHFAKNLCFSPQFVEQIRTVSKIPLDVHIMVKDMDIDIIEAVVDAGADYVSVHPEESNKNIFKFIDYVKGRGRKIGIVLNPATSLDTIRYYIQHVDIITFMAVTPGFSGQPLIPVVINKIEEALRLRESKGYKYLTQIDGGCNESTIKRVYRSGVDIIIVGKTLLFGRDSDLEAAWDMCIDTFATCIGV